METGSFLIQNLIQDGKAGNELIKKTKKKKKLQSFN